MDHKSKQDQIRDRVQSWARSLVGFLKEPLKPKDIFLGLGIAVGIVIVFQTPYFMAHVQYWFNQAASQQINTEETVEVVLEANQIYIPRIGVRAPLVYIDSSEELDIQRALRGGIVHYAETALPGEFGNAYYTGHSSDLLWKAGRYKTVFALLPYLEVDDHFFVTTEEAEQLQYRVIETKVVNPNDLSVLSQFDHERQLLTLQTSYPIGTAFKRYIVIAEMVSQSAREE